MRGGVQLSQHLVHKGGGAAEAVQWGQERGLSQQHQLCLIQHMMVCLIQHMMGCPAGNLVMLIHRLPYSATNFTVYELLARDLRPYCRDDMSRRLLAGSVAGWAGCMVVRVSGCMG